MNNWFSVGEEVLLESKGLPEYNGSYFIHAIVAPDEDFICRLTGKVLWTDEGVSYLLHKPLFDSIDGEGEAFFAEGSIRKKHKGCGEDWNIMMKGLNTKIVEVV
jgi:hypothetical protein